MAQIAFYSHADWLIESVLSSEQSYTSRNWDYEKSRRYIITSSLGIVEASHFGHYLKGQLVKTVVELPTSYGCQVGCAHCASGDIRTTRKLDAEDLSQIFSLVADDNKTSGSFAPRVIAFSGIGECSLNAQNVFLFCHQHARRHTNDELILTTVGTKPDFISDVERLAYDLPVRWLQVTLLHSDTLELVRVMGSGFKKYDFDGLIQAIDQTCKARVRLNYVVIDGFNSDLRIVSNIARSLSKLSNKITLRVSQLNETDVSRKNNIKQPSADLVHSVCDVFRSYNLNAYVFMSSFNDNMNCGQLVWKYA